MQSQNFKRKLPFGHFYVSSGSSVEGEKPFIECGPLTQDELADGWKTVMPKTTIVKNGEHIYKNPIHHWSISLSQLPPHLWRESFIDYDYHGHEYYPVIKNGIYHYSINGSEYDNMIRELYDEIQKPVFDYVMIKSLVSALEGKVNGWIMVRAKRILNRSIHNALEYY